MPQRIRLSRQKGWRKPPGAINVARPGRWGNPFKVGDVTPLRERDRWPSRHTQESAVLAYREVLMRSPQRRAAVRRELAGRDLACWCRVDQPCHADVLLEVANC